MVAKNEASDSLMLSPENASIESDFAFDLRAINASDSTFISNRPEII